MCEWRLRGLTVCYSLLIDPLLGDGCAHRDAGEPFVKVGELNLGRGGVRSPVRLRNRPILVVMAGRTGRVDASGIDHLDIVDRPLGIGVLQRVHVPSRQPFGFRFPAGAQPFASSNGDVCTGHKNFIKGKSAASSNSLEAIPLARIVKAVLVSVAV